MADKPVVLTLDDDATVSQSLTRDLRRQHSQRFRVVRVESRGNRSKHSVSSDLPTRKPLCSLQIIGCPK